MPEKSLLKVESSREFTLTLEPVSGGVTFFYAFINGIRVIQSDGSKKRTWSGDVLDAQVRIKVRVVGIGSASFKLGMNLPGNVDNQALILKLQDGYYEAEVIL